MKRKLIIDGNAVYELDLKCMTEKKNMEKSGETKKQQKEKKK